MYGLGVDLGESSVKAAIVRADGSLALAATGEQSLCAPTVAAVGGGAVVLVGDAAVAASREHPECRREGLLRGLRGPRPVDGPTIVELLTALVEGAVAAVSARQGGPPDRIVLTCPGSAPAVRRRVTDELAERLAAGPGAPQVRVIDGSDAVAAYATDHLPGPARRHGVLLVCDLGGGTCETTVLRGGQGFEVDAVDGAGFGGLDLDEALAHHVDARLGGRPDLLARSRLDARAARTRLSEVTEAVVPVTLPEGIAEIDLTREGLETMTAPALRTALDAARRALAASDAPPGVAPPVLLLGGLTRMPLVADVVSAELGRPVFPRPDHVEHAVALGAALIGRAGPPAPGVGAPPTVSAPSFVPERCEPERDVTPPLPVDPPSGDGRRRRVPGAAAVALLAAAALVVVGGLVLAGVRGSGEPATAAPAPVPSAAPAPAAGTPPAALGPAPIGVAASGPTPTLAASTVPVAEPLSAVVSPNGRLVYVASAARREIAVIDTTTGRVTATIRLPLPPRYLSVAPDGARVYAAMSDDARTRFALAAVDPVANRVLGAVPMGSRPFAPAASPDGRLVWVPEHEAGVVTLRDSGSGALVRSIPVGASPHAVALSADGTRAYVSLEEADELLELDTATGEEISRVATGRAPYLIALHPTRPLAVVSDYGGGSVTIVDTLENEPVGTVAVGRVPQGVAWSPDGRFAYVANSEDDTVSVVDARTLEVTATVGVPSGPTLLAPAPDGTRLYLTAPGAGVVAALELARR